jgi:hypothetical protein
MMKKLTLLATALLCAVAIFLAWPQQPKTETTSSTTISTAATSANEPSASEAHGNWPPASPYANAEVKRVPIEQVSEAKSAAQSLAETRNGDPRTPPIQRAERGEQPSVAELADPKLYQQYETRQNMKLYAAFVEAAKSEVPRLRADIERGRAAGIAPEKIARVEEKARRIEAMQAQLLREYPNLQAVQ